MRRAKQAPGVFEGFGLEELEGRQLLTADLAVAWNTGAFLLPTVVVPGDHIDPQGGANRLETPIQVINQGDTAAVGNVRIDFYLSADTVLNPNQDVLMKSYPSEALSLDVYTGDPNQIGTFSPDMTIPPTTAPGSYFLIVRIVPDGNIGDFDSGNNVAVSDDPIMVTDQFGSFSGRSNVALTLQDPEGTLITFNQTGGGDGAVAASSDGYGVTVNNGGSNTAVSITVSGGDGKYDLTGVTINGTVGSFSAPQGRLRAAPTTTTSFGNMTFGDVLGPMTITVPSSSASPSFTFGNVSELSINSAVGITALSDTTWTDFDSTPDSIRAPWLGTLTSAANFYPSLFLTGGTVPGATTTLKTVNIGGVIKRGAWSVNGRGGTISIYASTVFWSATFNGRVNALSSSFSYRGVFTALNIGSVTSGRDLLYSHILSGAYLGADGVFGGTGADADTYGPGVIGPVTAAHNIAGITIGAGLDPMDGVFGNGNDRIDGGAQSGIASVTVGHIFGAVARVITNTYGPITIAGVSTDWRFNSRFSLSTDAPNSAVQNAVVTSVNGAPTATIDVLFTSTGLMDLSSVTDGVIRVTGPGGFLGFGVLASKSLQASGTNATAEFTVTLAGAGDMAATGMYSITVVGDEVKDARGNAADPFTIGTFNV